MRLGTCRPILRRTLLELVHLFNERMDMIVRMLAIALVLSLLLHNVLHVSEMVERVLFEKSLVSRLVSGLVRNSYLKREIDPKAHADVLKELAAKI